MKLEWSPFAHADREAIFNYIEADSPHSAAMVDERIRAQIKSLLQFPESGRPGRIKGTQELVISHTPYIVGYRIVDDVIRILRVLHGVQIWPDEMPQEPI